MLSTNIVLEYIKDNLGWPFMHLELEDEQIIDYIQKHTVKEFSYYIPQVSKVPVNTDLPAAKVPGIANEFYIWDPDGLEILDVIEIYTKSSDLMLHGHPPIGPMGMGELADWALAVSNAMTVKMFSSFDMTFEFKHPNIVRISPVRNTYGTVVIEYERQQPCDLSGIPNDMHQFFKKLALGDIMMVIGRIRKRYGGGNLRTPFGEIPLESEILDEGKEMKREVIELLERTFIPNIRIEHG